MNGKDAIERITVEYQQLPAVTDTASAAGPAAPRLWEHSSSNVCLDAELADKAAMPRADMLPSFTTALSEVLVLLRQKLRRG